MNPQDILKQVRKNIRELGGEDPDKWFYANHFVYARLMLDERKTKTNIKQLLCARGNPCHYCGKDFESRKGIHLHRLDENRGYSDDNCVLMHPDCHEKFHAESPRAQRSGKTRRPFLGKDSNEYRAVKKARSFVSKTSKKYNDKSFLYWWDIWPAL